MWSALLPARSPPWLSRCLPAARPLLAGWDATPQILANAASLLIRSVFGADGEQDLAGDFRRRRRRRGRRRVRRVTRAWIRLLSALSSTSSAESGREGRFWLRPRSIRRGCRPAPCRVRITSTTPLGAERDRAHCGARSTTCYVTRVNAVTTARAVSGRLPPRSPGKGPEAP